MARFEREAKLLASLNHPNIAGIYGLEQADGKRFLVLEYVEGETLQARLSKGALPLDEALGVCRQIAEGLEAAHEKGVIHRDLKPANVMITGEEKVKILDFGLAKALAGEIQSVDASQSPTITEAMTQPGVVLGTAAYMSPEQAKGKSVDKRADIWAFGCILYECMTGKRVFAAETVTETLAAVITREPELEKVEEKVRSLLSRCLVKDPKKRLRDIGEAMAWVEGASPSAKSESINTKRQWLAWGIAIISLIGLLTLGTLFFLQIRVEIPDLHLQIITPPTSDPTSLALSPDGRLLVFVASENGQRQLWLRPLGEPTTQPLEGTEGATFPFWSPDSRSIGFFAEGKLKRKDIKGGPPEELASAPGGMGGTWNRDDIIVFARTYSGCLYRIPANGGEDPSPITQLDSPRQQGHLFPQFLPDGRHLLFRSWGSDEGFYLGMLDSDGTKRLNSTGSHAIYASPGYLLFMRQGSMFAQRLNMERGELTGDSVHIADSVAFDPNWGSGFSVSETGILAYRTAGSNNRRLAWFDRSGKEISILGLSDGNDYDNPELSPDGKRVLVDNVQGNIDLWIIDAVQGIPNRFTFNAAAERWGVWSPDGKHTAFFSDRENRQGDIYQKPASATGNEELLLDSPALQKIPVDWSPDGQHIIYVQINPETFLDVWVLPLVDDSKPFEFEVTEFEEGNCQFSPDGKWVAYQSNETGSFEIYVKAFPDLDGKKQLSIGGGIEARWGYEGRELFYIAPDGKMMAVPIQTDGQTLNAGAPVELFPTRIMGGGNPVTHPRHRYDVTLDGQRFLINVADESATSPITIVTNWFEELKERVATD
jgi:serine/threonine protein kinase